MLNFWRKLMIKNKKEEKHLGELKIEEKPKLGKTSILASFEYEEIKVDVEPKETNEDSKKN